MIYVIFGRTEYGVFWKCVQAGIGYALTQLVKMLLLATFFPSMDTYGAGGYDAFGVSPLSFFFLNDGDRSWNFEHYSCE
jgi:hypothetical protein